MDCERNILQLFCVINSYFCKRVSFCNDIFYWGFQYINQYFIGNVVKIRFSIIQEGYGTLQEQIATGSRSGLLTVEPRQRSCYIFSNGLFVSIVKRKANIILLQEKFFTVPCFHMESFADDQSRYLTKNRTVYCLML